MMLRPRVLVEVSGGVAEVTADDEVDVYVIDYDVNPDAEIPADIISWKEQK